jgi:hypothetical protein
VEVEMSVAPELPPPAVARRRSPADRTVVPFRRGRQVATAEPAPDAVRPDGAAGARSRSGAGGAAAARRGRPRPSAVPVLRSGPAVLGARDGHRLPAGRRLVGPARAAKTGVQAERPPANRRAEVGVCGSTEPAGSAAPGPQQRPGGELTTAPEGGRLRAVRPPAGAGAAGPGRAAPGPATVPIRLTPLTPVTPLGRLTLGSLAVLLGLTVLVGAMAAAARLGRPVPALPSSAPAVVVVQPGDTLWAIARRVAPERDPRDVVAELRQLNALPSADVRTGQRLRLRGP